jgi:hypothetical protein
MQQYNGHHATMQRTPCNNATGTMQQCVQFLHVFPRIEVVEAAAADSGEFSLDDMSPEYLCTIAAFDTCQKMVTQLTTCNMQQTTIQHETYDL